MLRFSCTHLRTLKRTSWVASTRYRAQLLQQRPFSANAMTFRTVLGIESTCDDSAVAIVRNRELRSDVSRGQEALARQFGGVFPDKAAQAHNENLPAVLQSAFEEAKLGNTNPWQEIDAIAVAIGPGMAPCLGEGLKLAKSLCIQHRKPLIPVNHLEAHALVARMTAPHLQFPYLTLLVSGGNTLLFLCEALGQYRMLGETIDSAIGECLDKAGRLLGVARKDGESYGAALERAANAGTVTEGLFSQPLPRDPRSSMRLSYAGLKSAMWRRIMARAKQEGISIPEKAADAATVTGEAQYSIGAFLSDSERNNLAASFQHTAIGHAASRTERAINWCSKEGNTSEPVKQLVLCGGVAASGNMRKRIGELCGQYGLELIVPPIRHCTDNGVMIAYAGVEHFQRAVGPDQLDSVNSDPDLRVAPPADTL